MDYTLYQLPGEILHMLKDKYKINTYLQDKYPHDPDGRDLCQCQIKQYLEKLYDNVNMLFKNKLHMVSYTLSFPLYISLDLPHSMEVPSYSS